tara:strand:+ start:7316 stop:8179 length:864 start_codon:yes stop_codon:yes gene_type:complete
MSDLKPKEVTFIFTVGGGDEHYENMDRCIESIRENFGNANFLIVEFGNKLKTKRGSYRVISLPDVIDFNSGKKVGYIIWKHKYFAALKVRTKYGIYVDTDTVMVDPRPIKKILPNLGGGIAVTQHFWVPTIEHYENKATNPETSHLFQEAKALCGLEKSHPFFAGGVFMFERNKKTKAVFQKVLEYYDSFYTGDRDYVKSITDELFLAGALMQDPSVIRTLSGAVNHCCMGDDHMPLTLHEGDLWGRNPWENNWTRVSFFHCNVARRDPTECYDGELKEAVKKAWGL